MNEPIQTAIDNLVETIKRECPPGLVALHIFINSEELTVEGRYRTAQQLKDAGISMRNIGGTFIK